LRESMRRGRFWKEGNIRGRTVSAGSAVQDVLHSLEKRLASADEQVFAVWGDAVGKEISEHAQPSAFNNGVLYVSVDSSAWLFKLARFHGEKIRNEINSQVGRKAVSKIIFRQEKI